MTGCQLIVVIALAGCEQWKAPQRIQKLEERVDELAGDVATLQGSGSGSARPKVAHADKEPAGAGSAREPAKGSGEPAAAGSGDPPAAKVSEEPAAHEPAAGSAVAGKDDKDDKAGKDDKPEADKPGKDDKPKDDRPKDDKPKDDKPGKDDKPEDKGDKVSGAVSPTDRSALEHLNAVVATGLAGTKPHEGKPHWGYDGPAGPESWGKLDPAWKACAEGKEQSPIDIEPHAGTATPIKFHYKPTAATVIDNGHTLQVNLAAGSSIEIDGKVFDLLQFHFHTPSEHTIAGEHYPLEVHLVHQGPTGKLAVIGVLYDVGSESRPLAGLWPPWPHKVGVADKLPRPYDPTMLLPETRTVFRYSGSLTTPPCTEAVLWNVMRRTPSDGRHHLEAFGERFRHNARDVQPLNDRKIE